MNTKFSKFKQCAACTNDIAATELIKCGTCGLRYHIECINTSYKKLNDLPPEYKTNWFCPSCCSKKPKGDNSNTPARGTTIVNVSPSSNITHRRPQPSVQPTSQVHEYFTLGNIKELIKEEMDTLLTKMECKFEKMMENKTSEMCKEMSEIKDAVNFINSQYEELKNKIQEKITVVKALKEENEKLKSTVVNLNSRLNLLEQHARMSNVEIQCIPEHKSENLPKIISQIGKVTGNNIPDTDIHRCTRIAKTNPTNSRPRSVIVKFASPRIRDTFLAGVIKFNKKNKEDKLNTSHAGIAGEKRQIYVVDHLTPELKKIHAFARITAKKLNYKYVWIKNGRVFLRKTDGSECIVIKNIEQLEQLKS